jgi:hypothetical protein
MVEDPSMGPIMIDAGIVGEVLQVSALLAYYDDKD